MSKKRYLLLLSFIPLFFLPALAGAGVFLVTNPTEFQAALTTAQSNGEDDTIYVAPGCCGISSTLTYSTEDGDGALTIEAQDPQHRPWIVGASGFNNVLMSIKNNTSDPNAHITIRNIGINAGHGTDFGGGLYVNAGRGGITIEGCNFRGNSAGWGGGAYVKGSGTAQITNNIFHRNNAEDAGGALWIESNTVIITNNIFGAPLDNENTARWGGGLHVQNSGMVTISENTFYGNNAFHCGGADVYEVDRLIFTNNILDHNNDNDHAGGACFRIIGSTIVKNNILSGNNSGGLFIDGSMVDISNNTFSSNGSHGYYGGAYVAGASMITNNTFLRNKGRYGGGIYARTNSGSITITNNTFYSNQADNGGGAYLFMLSDRSVSNIYNNIIWNNRATSAGNDLYVDSDGDKNGVGSTVILYNNDIGNNSDFTTYHSEDLYITNAQNCRSGGNITGDPLLVDPQRGDFHLSLGSACIDAGNNSAPGLPSTDYEGDPRVVRVVDIGADEYNGILPIIRYTLTVSKSGAGTTTVTSNPSGIDCGNICSSVFLKETNVTLVATADTRYVFVGWGGDCSSCGSATNCAITMDADKNCTAETRCSYSLSPASRQVGYKGKKGIKVRAVALGDGCPAPDVVVEDSWLKAERLSFKKNKAVLKVSVSRNESSLERMGAVVIGGEQFVVTQDGAPCAILGIDPSTATYPSTGGQGSFAVRAPEGCGWSAESDAPWVSILAGGKGTGNGTVTYAVEENTTGKNREGRVSVVSSTWKQKLHKIRQGN